MHMHSKLNTVAFTVRTLSFRFSVTVFAWFTLCTKNKTKQNMAVVFYAGFELNVNVIGDGSTSFVTSNCVKWLRLPSGSFDDRVVNGLLRKRSFTMLKDSTKRRCGAGTRHQ